jgi:hypothetical protein
MSRNLLQPDGDSDMSEPEQQAFGYGSIHGDIVALLETARRAAARSVNAVMTATY